MSADQQANNDQENLGRMLLLGERYQSYGAVAAGPIGTRTAAAISVGSDPSSPSAQFKRDAAFPNEDALCAIEAGRWAGFAVADAHFGHEASHLLISRLHEMWARSQPTSPADLEEMVASLAVGDPPTTESETTLLVVLYDRVERNGFGITFGDSTFIVVGPEALSEPLNRRDSRYVSTRPDSAPRFGSPFHFGARPGDWLLCYTDGVDECHYRRPETSIQRHHIESVLANAESPLLAVQQLTALALTGVDGNPGGQDNIAIIASKA